ncbi:MAG: outer membrane protein assembly factor BamB, partial [Verrucomicrobiota bacterium]
MRSPVRWIPAMLLAAWTATSVAPAQAQGEAGLLACWRFGPEWKQGTDLKAMFGGPGIPLRSPMRFAVDPPPHRLELNGSEATLIIAPDDTKALLPRREMTIEAWVRVDQPGDTAGIVGILADTSETNQGWQLAVRGAHFRFSLAAEGQSRLTALESTVPIEPLRWHHVAGTFDGAHQRLFVNGQLAGESREQTGALRYPPATPFLVGSLRASEPAGRLLGALHEIRLFQRALANDEIQQRFEARRREFPEPMVTPKLLRLAYGPFVDWADRHSAVVTWETDLPMPTRLELEGPGGTRTPIGETAATTRHSVTLSGLQSDYEYHYRIGGQDAAGEPLQTARYLFDTSFFYALLRAPTPGGKPAAINDRHAEAAARILQRTGVSDGYCLVLGAVDGRLALELVRQSRLKIVVVDPRDDRIAAVRRTLDAAGVYGTRASAQQVAAGPLPYGDLFANLVVSESALDANEPPVMSAAEVHRLLRPGGGVALLGGQSGDFGAAWTSWRANSPLAAAETVEDHGHWLQFRRDPLAGAGEWSHQYGSADNTSTSLDELVDGDLQVAWWGDPGPRPMPDRGNRNPAPLSVNGRLFIQGNRILFGLDAYNGTILWTLSAPEIRRANVTRDCSNMTAAGDRLYVAHGRWCLALDGQSGTRVQRFAAEGDGSMDHGGQFDWGYVSAGPDRLIGSRQKRDAAYLGDDGEWYEDF